MSKIQDDFNRQPGDFPISPGEYEGPLLVNRSCVIDGAMATLWAEECPILTIDAPGVTVKNLRVECTKESDHAVIQSNYPDAVLSGVEVNGNIAGFPAEGSEWNLPSVISLGSFAADETNTFSYYLDIPMDAQLQCTIKDIRVSPSALTRGNNQIFIETHEIRANTILYGEIIVRSTVSRRIYIWGKAEVGAPKHQAAPPLSPKLPSSEQTARPTPQEMIAPPLPGTPERTVVKGQRLLAKELPSQIIKAACECRGEKLPLEVDGYVFLLQDDGKVGGDNDLIFFGNPTSSNGSVSVSNIDGRPLAIIQLDKVDDRISKIAVCFSIYGSNMSENFSLVDAPMVRILAGEMDFCSFPLSGLKMEKTVVAIELYRYKNEWKIHFVGAGYHSGLERLCESYGVEVE